MGRGEGKRNPKKRLTLKREKEDYKNELHLVRRSSSNIAPSMTPQSAVSNRKSRTPSSNSTKKDQKMNDMTTDLNISIEPMLTTGSNDLESGT